MSDIIARIKGSIIYTDGSIGAFDVVYESGMVIYPLGDESIYNFQQLYNDKKSEVDQVFAAVDGDYTTSISQVAQVPDKTVETYWLEFNGRLSDTGIAADDTDWCVQWIDGTLLIIQAGTAYPTLLATTAFKTAIDSMLEGCAGNGSVSITSEIIPPNISYIGSPFTWIEDEIISPALVTSNGGPITSYAVVLGSLPIGISLNTSTGALTGTPTAAQGATNVTIRATGPGGLDNTVISITVTATAPDINYVDSPFTWNLDQAITPSNPINIGGPITSYAVFSGSLPTGISLNTSTGELTGTPTVEQGATNFTIRATGPGGTDDTVVSAEVIDVGALPVVGALRVYGSAGGMAPLTVQVHPEIGDYDWVTATSYTAGEYISNVSGSVVYLCLQNHTSGASSEPGVGASWQTYWSVSSETKSGFWGEGRWQYQFVKSTGAQLDTADRNWMRVTDPISGQLVYTDDRYSSAPTAAFMFRSPGTYKVRVRYQNRDHIWSAWVESSTITVAANTRTKRYVNGSIGSNSYDGTSATVDGGNVGPKLTIDAALDLIAGNNWEIEVADSTTCDAAAYSSNFGIYTGVWIHRSNIGGTKPIVNLKQTLGFPIGYMNSGTIVEGLEFEYDVATGKSIAFEVGYNVVNTTIADCDYNEVSELATIASDRYPIAVFNLRLVQKEQVTRYCIFADNFHCINLMGNVWNKGCAGEHVIRLVTDVNYGNTKVGAHPYGQSKYLASEYCNFNMAPGGSGKAAYNTHCRHTGAYRCVMGGGSVGVGKDLAYPTVGNHDINNVIDNCIIEQDGITPMNVNIGGIGQNVVRTSAFHNTGDVQNAGNGVIGCTSSGAVRILHNSVRQENKEGMLLFRNLTGPTDDYIVRGNIWSYIKAEHGWPWEIFAPAYSFAELAGMRWEDNVHMDAPVPAREFGFYNGDGYKTLADANGGTWGSGNIAEDHTFDADWQPQGVGELWKTNVNSIQGVFRSLNGAEIAIAGPAGCWASV